MSRIQTGTVIQLLDRRLEEDFPNLRTRQDSIKKTIVVPPEVTPYQRMAIVEASGVLDFWDEPEEDIYSPEDGDAV